jgi:O-antigen/teichoic acid export membrane protein
VVLFLVLARILAPEQLGLFSAAIAIIAIAELFADNGLGDAVIQSTDVDDPLLSAALCINIFLGLLLAVGLFLCAPMLELYFSAPGLAPLLSVAILSLLLNAGSYVPQSILRRRFEYRWLALRALIATTISGAVGIILALMGYGAWSMIVQVVLFALINFGIIWSRPPFNPLVRPDFKRTAGIMKFSVSILFQRILYTICTRAIELVLLHRFGPAALSMYIIGSRLYYVGAQMVTAVLMDVAYSTFSRLTENHADLERSFFSMLRGAVALTTSIFFGLGAVAPELCVVAFGDKGEAAAPYLFYVALFGNLQVAQFFFANVLSAMGRPVVGTTLSAIHALLCGLVLLPEWKLDITELVALNSATLAVMWPLYLICCARFGKFAWLQIVKAVYPSYVSGGMMIAAVELARFPLLSIIPSPFFRGAVLIILGAGVFIGLMRVLAPAIFYQALQLHRGFDRARHV